MPSCEVMPCPAAAFAGAATGEMAVPQATDYVQSSEVFSDDWSIYQKLLDGNYMHHIELYAALQQHMEQHIQGRRSFSVLDLGCGDSAYVAGMLRSSPSLASRISCYTGVDMSLPALALSTSNIRAAVGAQVVVEHHQTDILGFATQHATARQFDFVLASFSVHHLSASEKEQLISLVVDTLLKPGGTFCLVDVFLGQGEGRSDFLLRSKQAYESLTVFTAEEKHKMLEHTMECDYPESVETYTAWAAKTGSQVQLLADFGLFKAATIQAPVVTADAGTFASAA